MKKVTEELFFDYFGDYFLKSAKIRISHGCHGGCAFCPIPINEGLEVNFTPGHILKEWFKSLWESGINHLDFLDDTFLFDTEEIVQVLEELAEEGIGFAFSFAAPVKTLLRNQKHLLTLRKLGLRRVTLGVINSNQEVLTRYSLKFTPSDQFYAIQLLQALRVQVHLKYILFDPLTTIANLENDLAFLEKNKLIGLAPYTDILTTYLDLAAKIPLCRDYREQNLYLPVENPYLPFHIQDSAVQSILYWLMFFESEYGVRLSHFHHLLLELRSEMARQKVNWMVTNSGQELMYITLALRMMPYELFKALLECGAKGLMASVTETEMRRQCEKTFRELEEKYWEYRKTYNS